MKNYITLILLFLIPVLSLSQGHWERIDYVYYCHPLHGFPKSFRFEGIDCYDSLNCAAVGNMDGAWPWNRITTDGGKTWVTTLKDTSYKEYDEYGNYLGTYTPETAREIYYHSKNLCLILCESGYYWISRDNCATWERKKLDTEIPLKNAHFIDDNIGVIISWTEIFLTTDGGNIWVRKEPKHPDGTIITSFLDIWIPGKSIVYALVYDIKTETVSFIRSEDFGNSWKYYDTGIKTTSRVFFVNKDVGWIAGGDQIYPGSPLHYDIIYKTTDGGRHWRLQLDSLPPIRARGLTQIYFSDENNGVAIGPWYKFLRTRDGGETWIQDTTVEMNKLPDYFRDVAFFDHDNIIALTFTEKITYRYSKEITDVSESNPLQENGIEIFPNPLLRGDVLNIDLSISKGCKTKFELIDTRGCRVSEFEAFTEAGKSRIQFDTEIGIPAGLYFLKMIWGTDVYFKKIILLD